MDSDTGPRTVHKTCGASKLSGSCMLLGAAVSIDDVTGNSYVIWRIFFNCFISNNPEIQPLEPDRLSPFSRYRMFQLEYPLAQSCSQLLVPLYNIVPGLIVSGSFRC